MILAPRLLVASAGLAAIASFAPTAAAQQEAAPAAPAPTAEVTEAERKPEAAASEVPNNTGKWTLRIEPSVWFVAPGGDVKLPAIAELSPSGNDVGINSIGSGFSEFANLSDLELDRPEASPSGEIHLGYDNWRVCLRGFSSSTDADTRATGSGSINGMSFVADDVIESSLDFLAAEAEVGYAFWHNTPKLNADGKVPFRSTVEGVGGVRLYDVDWAIQNVRTSSQLEAEESFFEPLLGGRFAMEFYQQFDIDVQLTVGGLPLDDNSSFSVDVMAGFAWRPIEQFGVQLGYRQLLFNLQSGSDVDEFEYDGALAGLYGGIVLKF